MSAYFIANIRIKSQAEYAKYIAGCENVFAQFNGKYIAVEDNPTVLEGSWNYTRLVLIEFPDKKSLDAWYHSSSYQEILKYRLKGAECDTVVVESQE